MYDCAVIGTGAAGVSAALTLKALNKNFIWFGSLQLSVKIGSAEKIRNYPGLPFVSGSEMTSCFLRQIGEMGIDITPKRVTGVFPAGESYGVLCDGDIVEAKTVIIATGVEAVKPVKGEIDFLGKGVSYCATCDGFLYKNKTIAVVCTTKQLEHEIEYLASLAEKVYVFAVYKNAQFAAENIVLCDGMPSAIEGDGRVEKIVLSDGKQLAADGVFMLKSAILPSALLKGLEVEDGHIKVNRACETNLKGCFAAGDCTGRPYQYAKAVGEGNVAAHSVNAYLASLK